MTATGPLAMAAAAAALLILGSAQGQAQQGSMTGAPQAARPGGSDAAQGAEWQPERSRKWTRPAGRWASRTGPSRRSAGRR